MNQIYAYIPSKDILISASFTEEIENWVQRNIYDIYNLKREDVQVLNREEYLIKDKEFSIKRQAQRKSQIEANKKNVMIEEEEKKKAMLDTVLGEFVSMGVVTKQAANAKSKEWQDKIDNLKKQ